MARFCVYFHGASLPSCIRSLVLMQATIAVTNLPVISYTRLDNKLWPCLCTGVRSTLPTRYVIGTMLVARPYVLL